ncbi:WD40-repeat-containing domain protein [Chytridium lagenaria]|nr:WD40-repeat-containing domain protein [Chytridium lagenaria]
MFCAISGEVPQEPVVSKKTGFLYEKRLIVKHIADNGKEPGTGEELSEEDLLVVKLSSKVVRPRPPTVNSVPALLSLLQNEWDSVMLETYQLKQQYHQSRQELSNALYENDAAKRVIARLVRERDQARENLAAISAATASAVPAAQSSEAASSAMDVDEPHKSEEAAGALPSEVLDKIGATAVKLSEARRTRKGAKAEVATVEDVKSFSEVKKVTGLHSKVGITAMDLLVDTVSGEKREWVITGGNDGTVSVTNWREGEQAFNVKAHGSKKVSSLLWIDRGPLKDSHAFVSGSIDKTVKVWNLEKGTAKLVDTISDHDGEVAALALQPSGEYFVSASTDGSWSFNDISRVSSVKKFSGESGYTSASFHPDGLLLGLGSKDSTVSIWDIKVGSKVQSFDGHAGAVSSIAFSENGYYLATVANGAPIVKLWDLRKLSNFHSIDLSSEGVKNVHKVAFDLSAQYLAVSADKGLRIYLNKKWTELYKAEQVHSSDITDIKFGENSKYIVSAGTDRSIIVTGV